MSDSQDYQRPRLLSVEEVANTLHVHPQTVRNLIRSGELNVVPASGRGFRVSPEELERFISAGGPRKQGRPASQVLRPYTVVLEFDAAEWAKEEEGGLSGTLRRLLRQDYNEWSKRVGEALERDRQKNEQSN